MSGLPIPAEKASFVTVVKPIVAIAALLAVVISSTLYAAATQPGPGNTPDSATSPAVTQRAINTNPDSRADEPGSTAPQSVKVSSANVNAYYRIVGTALQPIHSSTSYSYDTFGCQSSPGGWFNAPIQLPQGAVIKYLRVYYHNMVSGSAQSGTAYIGTYDGLGGSSYYDYVYPRSANAIGGTGWNSDVSAYDGQIVDNYSKAYLFTWSAPGTDQSLCGIRINYDRPIDTATFLPLVNKP